MKPSHEIEKIRVEEFDEKLDKFYDDDNHYTKHTLEKLKSKYLKAILPRTRGFHEEFTTFFNVIEELQKKHETMVKNIKRKSKAFNWNTIGNSFKEAFIQYETSLLNTYMRYFEALNKLMPQLKKKIASCKELFQVLLVLNSEQRDNETLLSLMYKPMTRLLCVIHQLEELIFLLTSIRPLEADKLVKTKNALFECFLNGPRMPTHSTTPLSSPSTSVASTSSPPKTEVTPPIKTLLGKRLSSARETSPKSRVRPRVAPVKVPKIIVHPASNNPKKQTSSHIRKPLNFNNLMVPSRK